RKAATEEELLRKIEIEEEVEGTIEQHIREKQELSEKVTSLEGRNDKLQGKNVELKGENVELKGENAELKKRLEELEKQFKNKK
ncbi:MAG: hypothetical protein AAGJ18_03670, partial [Bacteroidota bacterium]